MPKFTNDIFVNEFSEYVLYQSAVYVFFYDSCRGNGEKMYEMGEEKDTNFWPLPKLEKFFYFLTFL